jgi:hypothetical protein
VILGPGLFAISVAGMNNTDEFDIVPIKLIIYWLALVCEE